VITFDEFLTLPGCTTGSHSSEKVARPVPVSTSAASSATLAAPTSVEGGTEVYGSVQRTMTPVPRALTPMVVDEKKPEPLEEDDPSLPVEPGTKCRRRGCNAEYVSDEISRAEGYDSNCVFHPG
jgi:hypothetical protein